MKFLLPALILHAVLVNLRLLHDSRPHDDWWLYFYDSGSSNRKGICITGVFYGQSFNRILTIAHALWHAADLGMDVRLTAKQMEWYQQWFEKEEDVSLLPTTPTRFFTSGSPRIRLLDHDDDDDDKDSNSSSRPHRQCGIQHSAKAYYRGEFLKLGIRGYQPSLDWLLPRFRRQYLDEAASRLQAYRLKAAATLNTTVSVNEIKVVTVHSRWLEGSCPNKAAKGNNFCASTVNASTVPRAWLEGCSYTQDYVQQHLPPEFRINRTVIVLLADGQQPEAEATFGYQENDASNSSFPVQVAMMMQSDYHFGNVQSSVDAVVAHWRQGGGQFPEDCYAPIVNAYRHRGPKAQRS